MHILYQTTLFFFMPIYLLLVHRIMYPIYKYVGKKKLFMYFLLVKRKKYLCKYVIEKYIEKNDS